MAVPFEEQTKEFARQEAIRNPEFYWENSSVEELSEKVPSKIQQYFENKYPNARPIGMGAFGVVYDIGNNKVVKITTDRAEIGFLKHRKKNKINHPFLINVYDVEFLGKTAIIEMEKIIPLSEKEKQIYNLARYEDYKKKESMTPKSFQKAKDRGYGAMESWRREQMRKSDFYKKSYEFYGLVKKHKLNNDAHSNNVGIRSNGDLVLLDMRNKI